MLIWTSTRTVACIAGLLVTSASIIFAYGDSFAALFLSRIIAGFGSVVMYSAVLGIAEGALGTNNKGSAVGTVYAGAAAGSSVVSFSFLLVVIKQVKKMISISINLELN